MKCILSMAAMILLLCLNFSCGHRSDGPVRQADLETKTIAQVALPTGLVSADSAGLQSNTAKPDWKKEDRQKAGQQQSPPDKKSGKEKGQIKLESGQDWDRKILKTGNLGIQVKDYPNYSSQIREKIKGVGAYIAQEEQNQTDYQVENTMIIKVPVEKFDELIGILTTGIEKLNTKKIAAEDIGAELVDTRGRLEAKQQARARYIDLMHQAKNMEDMISIQQELNSVQEDIESVEARVNYLSHSASYSTINLDYYQILEAGAADNKEPSFLKKIGHSFFAGWSWLGELITGMVAVWPLLILLPFLFFLLRRFFKIRNRTTNRQIAADKPGN